MTNLWHGREDVPASSFGVNGDAGAADFEPSLYTCQVNVIDEASGQFAFPRLVFYVRQVRDCR